MYEKEGSRQTSLWSSSKHPGHGLFLILDCIGTCLFWRQWQQQSSNIHKNSYCCAKRRVSCPTPASCEKEESQSHSFSCVIFFIVITFKLSYFIGRQIMACSHMGKRKMEKEGKKQSRKTGLQKFLFAHITFKHPSPTRGWGHSSV